MTVWSTRWVPDAFVIAILLTLVTGLLVGFGTASGPIEVVEYWGEGLWALLGFSMQICLIIMTGTIIGVTPFAKRLLNRLANLAKSPQQAVALTALASMILCLINWGMGLIMSSIMVLYMATSTAQRGIKVDYRLLCACAYLGMATTWHAGLSGSAPLLVATPGHFLESDHGLISAGDTIFQPFNLILLGVTIPLMVAIAWWLHPSEEKTVAPQEDSLAFTRIMPQPTSQLYSPKQEPLTPSEKMERSPWISGLLALLAFVWLALFVIKNGFKPTLNIVILVFLAIGLILHRSPRSFLAAAEDGSRHVWGVILQFPLYAGIFGMIKYSGFQDTLAQLIVSNTSPELFPLLNCWHAGVLNYFVPSGGGQWAMQAPYIMEAGKSLGVAPQLTVLSYAWGEMLSDGIQPFFAIPLLGITRVGFRDIMGFLLIFVAAYTALVSIAFLFAPQLPWFTAG